MNILYHHRTHARGAEGVHIRSIVTALEKLGHTVDILSVPGVNHSGDNVGAPVDKSREKVSGLNHIWSFMSNRMPGILFELAEIFYNIPAYYRLLKKLKVGDYDLIYERYAYFLIAGALAAKKYNIPFVLEANEVNGIQGRARKQYLTFICIFIEKKLFLLSSRIITVSSFLADLINKRLYKTNFNGDIIVAPNAINLDKIPSNSKSDHLLEKYSINSNQKVIGFAGWFDDWDRLDILIRVISTLRASGHDVVGLLIGDGVGVSEAKILAKEHNISKEIIFTGAVSRLEIYPHLNLLDIALFPHSNEYGSPVVMFEFMALRIPIVAPKLRPIMDVLTHQENSLLFDVLNETDLTGLIKQLLDNDELAENISNNAYKLLTSKHTWVNNASLIVEPFIK